MARVPGALLMAVVLLSGCPQQEPTCLNCADLAPDVSTVQDVPAIDDSQAPPDEQEPEVVEPALELPLPCDEIYSQDELPTYEITIKPEYWAMLQDEYDNWQTPAWEDKYLKQYVPLQTFVYKDEVLHGAAIRLKGNPYHWTTGKMQFNISFKQYDEKGRFHELRKLNLDAPTDDPSLMHDRLGMSVFRDLGLAAPCCNHVRLVVNGEYYGIFSNIEHVDQEFLYRNYGHDDEGNLYKWIYKKTHEADPATPELDKFEANLPLPALEQLLDLNQALLFWAGEAVIPQLDGYVVGGINYYLYGHPKHGLLFIPWDVDYSFEVDAEHTYYDVDPETYEVGWGYGKPHHMLTVLADDEWRAAYHAALATALEAYDTDVLHERTAAWGAQVREALETDPNRFFSMEEHDDRLALLDWFVVERANYLNDWLACKSEEAYTQNAQALSFEGAQFSAWLTRCNWTDAQARCHALGGQLATPSCDSEQTYLVDALLSLDDENWWIGMTDADSEGQWCHPDGSSPDYEAWDSNQPDGGETQNCGVIANNLGGDWNDKPCHQQFPSICRLP